MVVDEGTRFVKETSALTVDEIEAEERIFAGPVIGSEPAGGDQRLFFYKKVAAGEIIAFANTPRGVSETGPTGDDLAFINSAAQLGEEGVIGRGNGRTPDAHDAWNGKISKGTFHPIGGRVGIVVEKGNDFAAGFLYAEIAFFGRAKASGGDFAHVRWPGVIGGVIG